VGKEILTYDDLLQIVELIKSAESFSEFHLKIGDIELDLRKSGAGASGAPSAGTGAPLGTQSIPQAAAPAPVTAAGAARATGAAAAPEMVPALERAVPARPAPVIPSGAVTIKSPMVGTFYRAPEPGARPFVEVGQAVTPNTTVCIIEVMKLMNSIPAGCNGTVTQVLVGDAEAVDAGQILIVIDPKA
jgi:acetyl-CoA carboxylase biotin carboxyl carrier protein